uniref:Uncharacterized protein n=1 Tax=Ciona intestinalis TaxID=7719 RepID=H2Y3A8_CIOIN
ENRRQVNIYFFVPSICQFHLVFIDCFGILECKSLFIFEN